LHRPRLLQKEALAVQQLELEGALRSEGPASPEVELEYGQIEIVVALMARMMIEIIRLESEADDDR
jgi:hypothetical protein